MLNESFFQRITRRMSPRIFYAVVLHKTPFIVVYTWDMLRKIDKMRGRQRMIFIKKCHKIWIQKYTCMNNDQNESTESSYFLAIQMEYLIVHETGIPVVNIHNRTAILNQVRKVPSKQLISYKFAFIIIVMVHIKSFNGKIRRKRSHFSHN